jgi:hypothetical protein
MKKLVVLLVAAFVLTGWTMLLDKDTYLRYYYRKDGTYVRPHY